MFCFATARWRSWYCVVVRRKRVSLLIDGVVSDLAVGLGLGQVCSRIIVEKAERCIIIGNYYIWHVGSCASRVALSVSYLSRLGFWPSVLQNCLSESEDMFFYWELLFLASRQRCVALYLFSDLVQLWAKQYIRKWGLTQAYVREREVRFHHCLNLSVSCGLSLLRAKIFSFP